MSDAWAVEDPAEGRTFGFLLQDVARLLKRHFERRARQAGLPITRRQAAVMIYVSRHEGVSQAEVATRLDLEPISLVRLLDKLCEDGLMERHAHPTDRRVRTLWLTPAARPALDSILRINREIRSEAFAGLAPVMRDAFIDALEHVKGNLAAEDVAGVEAMEIPSPSP